MLLTKQNWINPTKTDHSWSRWFYESAGLPKAPVNRSGEGVMLKMALVVVNALKAPESESLWNQEARLQICGFNLWAYLAVTYRNAQQVLPPD